MIRLSTFLWLIVLALIGVGVFQLKYAVQAQEKELVRIRAEIKQHLGVLHLLKAEWSYLNDPVRLADLARRHTDLIPVTAAQISGIEQLPVRANNAPAIGASRIEPAIPTSPSLNNVGHQSVVYSEQDRHRIDQMMQGLGQ